MYFILLTDKGEWIFVILNEMENNFFIYTDCETLFMTKVQKKSNTIATRGSGSFYFLPQQAFSALMCLLMLLMSSCGLFNNRLKKDDLRLMSNRIVFVNTQHLQNKSQLKLELAAHYKQKPKTLTQDPFDLKPVLWNQLLMDSTRNEMARVLQNKGYLYASVEDNADKNNKENEVAVTYTVNPGVQFVLDTVTFFSPDPNIQAILDSIKPGSLLKSGDPLNGKTLGDEKARIRNFLNNNGYAQFTPNYFNRLEGGDSSIVVFDEKGKPTKARGRSDGIPVWSFAAVYAENSGDFVILH